MRDIYRFNPGDWVIRGDAQVPQAQEILFLKNGSYWVQETTCYSEHSELRLATNEEIIKEGGTPKKIELNYEIF